MMTLVGLGIVGVILGVGLLVAFVLRRVVPTNEVHIVQSAKKTVSYGKDTGSGNTYYEFPAAIPFLGVTKVVMPVSNFDVSLKNYDAYDKGRLPFVIDAVAFFRIEDSNMAAQRVSSFEELQNQLSAILQGAVRSILAKSDIESIMEDRSIFGEKFTAEVTEQLANWGVVPVKNIELMDIRDTKESKVIHNIMEKKKSHIEMESRTVVAENNKKAQMAEIESKREVDLQTQQAKQAVGLRTAESEREVELANQKKSQAVKEQERLTKEKEMEVLKVQEMKKADILKNVALVKAEQDKEVALVKAEQDKKVELIDAEKEKEVTLIEATKLKESGVIKADGELVVKTKQAEAEYLVTTRKADADLLAQQKAAQGVEAQGLAKAKALEAEGLAKAKGLEAEALAPVNAQTTLAKEIGSNKEYQQYLITIEQIAANKEVGKAQAEALANANVKILANSGTATSGINKVTDVFSSQGGVELANMLEGLQQSDVGQKLLSKLIKSE